jgi:hypothetical protein
MKETGHMMRFLGLLLVVSCLVSPAQAQNAGSPEALAAAKELSAIITGNSIQQMSRAVTAKTWPEIERKFGGKVDSATLSDMRAEFQAALAKFTSDIMKETPAIYAKYFSANELHDMLAFYKTPTGAKALRMMPTLAAEIAALIGPRAHVFQQELASRMIAVMKKHGYGKK